MDSKLDLQKIPKLIGQYSQDQAKKCYKVLKTTNWPLYLIGPSGSSKTITAMNLAKKYALDHQVPAYYVQLSPELTKTSLILGHRLVKGSLEVVEGVVAKCMQEGGIIIVDEATHGTQELLLMFNSILDRTSATSIGDKIVYSKPTFRVIFCSNDSKYAGNVRLPQSFAQRLAVFNFEYPTWQDEMEISKNIASTECSQPIVLTENVAAYVTNMMRDIRNKDYPLSARNMAIALVLLNLADKKSSKIDEYFTVGQNTEAIRTKIAERTFGGKVTSAKDLISPEVVEVTQFISDVGIENFRKAMYSSMLFYLDIDGTELMEDEVKNKIQNSIC